MLIPPCAVVTRTEELLGPSPSLFDPDTVTVYEVNGLRLVIATLRSGASTDFVVEQFDDAVSHSTYTVYDVIASFC